MKRTIAGHEIELTEGLHYIATRPMGELEVYICGYNSKHVYRQFFGLTYDEANELLNAFNNGAVSFDGRVW